MKIFETERLILREIVESDAAFIVELLNSPSFIKYIGNRNIRSVAEARGAIENVYRKSYAENNFGLYIVELKESDAAIGFCGFVKRDFLPEADIGFAFLPQFEKKGHGFESAAALLKYGREKLNFGRVLAITTPNNENSVKLLEKLGFVFENLIEVPPNNEKLKLFAANF